jgi:hypothetical protein
MLEMHGLYFIYNITNAREVTESRVLLLIAYLPTYSPKKSPISHDIR